MRRASAATRRDGPPSGGVHGARTHRSHATATDAARPPGIIDDACEPPPTGKQPGCIGGTQGRKRSKSWLAVTRRTPRSTARRRRATHSIHAAGALHARRPRNDKKPAKQIAMRVSVTATAFFELHLFFELRRTRVAKRKWWVLRGSNSRPTPCKGAALPTELSTRSGFTPILDRGIAPLTQRAR